MKNQVKAIVLAAGKGMRFRPLTNNCPKPLLKTLDKAVLEHNLNQLNGLIDEVILIIGYRGEIIRNTFGVKHRKLKISYIEQEPQKGTGDAAKLAYSVMGDKFLLLNGDDLYSKEDIEKVLDKFPSILLSEVKYPSNFGVIETKNGLVKGIIEKPKKLVGNLVNTGLYYLPKNIFDYNIKLSPRGEYEFTDYVNGFLKKEKLYWVKAKNWVPLSYPWNLFDANEFLLSESEKAIEGTIESNCIIKGKIILKQGAVIKGGSYLEGPIYIGRGAVIGPNCYLKGPLSIGAGVIIEHGAEVKHSIIGDRSKIAQLSSVTDSIIGSDCDLAAGTQTANFRFDQENIKVNTNGKIIDTNLKKFGCIMGDNVMTGINTSIMPGIIIGDGAIIGPHSIVMQNVVDHTTFFNKAQKASKKKSNI